MGDDREEPNREQTEGRIQKGVGEIEEAAGDKTRDEELSRKGEADQVAGRATEDYGNRQPDAGKKD